MLSLACYWKVKLNQTCSFLSKFCFSGISDQRPGFDVVENYSENKSNFIFIFVLGVLYHYIGDQFMVSEVISKVLLRFVDLLLQTDTSDADPV